MKIKELEKSKEKLFALIHPNQIEDFPEEVLNELAKMAVAVKDGELVK